MVGPDDEGVSFYEDDLSSLVEMLGGSSGENSPASRHALSVWIDPCLEAAQFDGMSGHVREQLGLRKESLRAIQAFCSGGLPGDLDFSSEVDMRAIEELRDEYFDTGSAATIHKRLKAMSDQESVDSAVREAIRILSSTLDEGGVCLLHWIFLFTRRFLSRHSATFRRLFACMTQRCNQTWSWR